MHFCRFCQTPLRLLNGRFPGFKEQGDVLRCDRCGQQYDGSFKILKRRCPACLSRTLDEAGDYDICSWCHWEDDPLQRHNPGYEHGPNHMSLLKGIWVALDIAMRRKEFKRASHIQRYLERVQHRKWGKI